jgi:hypothetical protein
VPRGKDWFIWSSTSMQQGTQRSRAGPAHQSYLQGYDVACACQGGGCSGVKNGKAEKYIAFPAYIRKSRWKRPSLVESRLGSNLRRNRFEGLQALSSPWDLWYGQSQKVEITVHCYICCLLKMAPSLAIGAEAMVAICGRTASRLVCLRSSEALVSLDLEGDTRHFLSCCNTCSFLASFIHQTPSAHSSHRCTRPLPSSS